MLSKYQNTPRSFLIQWLDSSDNTIAELINGRKKSFKVIDKQANKIKKLKEEIRNLLENNIRLETLLDSFKKERYETRL